MNSSLIGMEGGQNWGIWQSTERFEVVEGERTINIITTCFKWWWERRDTEVTCLRKWLIDGSRWKKLEISLCAK